MHTKKSIFVATGIYPPESGGPATYAKFLEDKLPARGYSVYVLPFRSVRFLPKVLRHAAYFFLCLVHALRADVVYALDTLSVGLPASLAAMLMRRPFMVRVPGDYAWEQARQRFGVEDELDQFQTKKYTRQVERMRSLQQFVVRRAKAVVVPSEYMKRIVSGWLVPSSPLGTGSNGDEGTDGSKVHRIYSSIQLPPEYELPADKPAGFLVLTIARMVPWKGIDALREVVAREPRWVFKHIDNMPHAQAMGWLKTADVFVLNSTYEGLSHLLVEAMALGTPVVATDVGGNPEIVENEVSGLLVPAKDDEALHAAIKRVEQDRVGAAARAAQALARTKQFSIDNALNQLTQLFEQL
jgi:glycosyltransferase involved in cell wall biosynthesis